MNIEKKLRKQIRWLLVIAWTISSFVFAGMPMGPMQSGPMQQPSMGMGGGGGGPMQQGISGIGVVQPLPAQQQGPMQGPSNPMMGGNQPQKPAAVIMQPITLPGNQSAAVQSTTTPQIAAKETVSLPVDNKINEQDVDEPDPVAIDFTDEDVMNETEARATSGNWVFKNYWWRKIEEEYSALKEVFEQVLTIRIHFFTKRAEIDKELDVFYVKLGFEQGPLEDIIKFSLDLIEKEKTKQQGMLTSKESVLFDKVKEKQRQLEQLREDLKLIQELDHKVDEALETLLSQIDLCNKYQQAAWDIFRKISHELNDKVARKQFYVVKGLLENAQHVLEYITSPFSVYFEQLVQVIKEHMQLVSSQMNDLAKNGVDLKAEADAIEKEDEEQIINARVHKEVAEKMKAEKAVQVQAQAITQPQKKELQKEQTKSWWSAIKDWVISVFEKTKNCGNVGIDYLSGAWNTTKNWYVQWINKEKIAVVKQ